MKTSTYALLLLALVPTAHAARAWLLPGQTIVARNGGWVTVDGAMSDDLFSFNQGALIIDALAITGPDGALVTPQNVAKGKTRSSFDLELRQPGTYRVAVADDVVVARWEEGGKPARWRGTPAEMAANIPAGAAQLEVEQLLRRVETFVTVGAPSPLKPSGKGLELVSEKHPNDLYAGEAAKLRILLDGKPAAGLEVEIVAGGTRYRNTPDEIKLKTDKEGLVTVTWPAAGMYWVDVGIEDENAAVPNVKKRRVSYNATFEVLPQ